LPITKYKWLEEIQMNTAPLGWTRWFRCESSFDLSLVPQGPGLFAMGREEANGKSLGILTLEETDDLFHTLNQLFSAGSPSREKLGEGHFMVRYASVPEACRRQETLTELRSWLADQGETCSHAVNDFLGVAPLVRSAA
jgi:hypothetical protein